MYLLAATRQTSRRKRDKTRLQMELLRLIWRAFKPVYWKETEEMRQLTRVLLIAVIATNNNIVAGFRSGSEPEREDCRGSN